MRRIVVFNNVSADGYFSRLDGSLDWVEPDPEFDRAAMSGPRMFDTVLFGRRTYEMFAAFWPHALDNPPPPRASGGHEQRSVEMERMANFLNNANKLVFSKSLKESTWKNTKILQEFSPKMISKMKTDQGGDMLVFGSGTIVTQLTQARLIDEYQFVVRPIILGSGRPMLSGSSADLPLKMEEAKGYPSGTVMLRYTPRA